MFSIAELDSEYLEDNVKPCMILTLPKCCLVEIQVSEMCDTGFHLEQTPTVIIFGQRGEKGNSETRLKHSSKTVYMVDAF